MEKIAYTNTGKNPVYIGGVMIPPDDTREVDASLVPGFKPDAAASGAAEPTYIVDVLMQKPASEIMAAIPTLAIEDLEKLGEAEQTGPARKEVLAAIAEHLLSHANKAVEAQNASSQSGQNQQQIGPQNQLEAPASQILQNESQPAGKNQQTNQDLQDLANAVSQPVDDAAPKSEAQEGEAQ